MPVFDFVVVLLDLNSKHNTQKAAKLKILNFFFNVF